ncbi:hypothetical protein HM131_02945 [Halobacillus mangrovi]|uniref:Uncharacterized protein n=2 Tax=Halobacillus mangrovi TaxID=402384 RepID=A0A1W5ZRC5_9BACI|nr:hypothetical protein HM131_02945 [Halobacillus mangrovi]
MWHTLLVISASIGIFLLEFPRMKRAKKKKEMWYFTILLFIMTFIAVLESRGVELPNPLDYIQSFYRAIHSWFGF